jgi:zinc ribbon protein
MDIVLIVLIIFVTFVVLGYPLIYSHKYQYVGLLRGNERLENLENARIQTLDAIRDLQFDHATSKLSDTDYRSLRSQYEYKAAQILQQLDAIKGQPKRSETKALASAVCPRCHASVDPSDKFCMKCGRKL